MKKTKDYKNIKFSSRIIRRAIDSCAALSNDKKEGRVRSSAALGHEKWEFDKVEDFLSYYGSDEVEEAALDAWWDAASKGFSLHLSAHGTQIGVQGGLRASIESVFSIFEEAPPEDRAAPTTGHTKAFVFIGHGDDRQWEKLKAQLQGKLGLDVIAYETGARGGHTIRDILDNMARKTSMALLVLTGEDKTASAARARQNVIYECGLFQGRLGFDRAILVVEQGVELASDFDGVQQLAFRKGRISDVFEDAIAAIRRELGSSSA